MENTLNKVSSMWNIWTGWCGDVMKMTELLVWKMDVTESAVRLHTMTEHNQMQGG